MSCELELLGSDLLVTFLGCPCVLYAYIYDDLKVWRWGNFGMSGGFVATLLFFLSFISKCGMGDSNLWLVGSVYTFKPVELCACRVGLVFCLFWCLFFSVLGFWLFMEVVMQNHVELVSSSEPKELVLTVLESRTDLTFFSVS